MVRHTEPDFDAAEATTDRLVDYINAAGPVAADLPDGEYAEPVLTANVEAAVAELKARDVIDRPTDASDDHLTGDDREPTDAERGFGETVDAFETATADAVADGGVTVDDVVDDEFGDESHYLRHTTADDYDVAIRHDGNVRTEVVGDTVVHHVTENYNDDAAGESLRWDYAAKCPHHGRPEKNRVDDGDVTRFEYECTDDECPYTATLAKRGGVDYDDPDYERPLWFRATVPHDFEKGDFDPDTFDDIVDAADHDDEDDAAGVGNVFRRLHLNRHVNAIRDAAHVKAEWEDDEKVEDAYIDTFECSRCGAESDAGAEYSHPAYDDAVCRDCEDAPEWTPDDADVPDDVSDMVDSYGSIDRAKVVALLRDVKYWKPYIAGIKNNSDSSGLFTIDTNDETDADEVPACPTGKQGERRVRGTGSPGTGLRRPDGVAHGDSHWRVVVREARDAGLIDRADDGDADFDEPAARWEVTEKGDRVFDEWSRCSWCGGKKTGVYHKKTVKLSRHSTTTNHDLETACDGRCGRDFKGRTFDLS